MSKLFQQTSLIIYKRFTFFWILLSIILLIVVLYINWQIGLDQSYQDISETATKISNNADRFIEDLYQEMYTLPVFDKKVLNCSSDLYPYMERITANFPNISGVLINSQNKVLCTTVKDINGLKISATGTRSILGPFKLSIFDQPVYLVQQKINNFYVGFFVLTSVFKSVLYTSDNNASSIELYDHYYKKNILRIERVNNNSPWLFNENPDDQPPNSDQALFAQNKLYSVDGMSAIVSMSESSLLRNLVHRESTASIIVLFTSCLLYFIIKNIMTRRYSLVGAIKLAIKNKEFYPAYQPLYDKQAGKYSGVEVLLRWQNNEDEIIMPDLFIVEAETNGLIIPITLQIIEIAFIETKNILNKNPQFHLAFNISALHFTDEQFFNKFNLLTKQYRITPEQVILEITERDLLDKNNDLFFNKMKELRQEGFSLAVDDYGTGHASISYLHNFPFNYLKIDKLFIQAIGTKAITESLNDVIINMAKRLDLIIIAEGVETEEQVTYLWTNGVRYLQGWYYSKALSIEHLINLLKGEENESEH